MRRLTGAGILVGANGRQFGVNQVGVSIWDLLDEPRSLDELVDALLREFDIPEARCREEAESFVGELLKQGLIERVEHR